MSSKPFISTRLFLPDTWIDEVTIRTQLTVYPKVRHGDKPRDPIPLYDLDSYPGYIGVPISWGMKVYGNREKIEDRTVLGRVFDPPERPDPNHPSVREPEVQSRFMEEILEANIDHYVSLGVAPPGTGKSLKAGTPVLMADGAIKPIEQVVVGDRVMGPNGPNNVLALGRGREMMYRVTQAEGEPYTVNASHILSLKVSCTDNRFFKDAALGGVINIAAQDYVNLGANHQSALKGWRAPVASFEVIHDRSFLVPPYIAGIWLISGCALASDRPDRLGAVAIAGCEGAIVDTWIDWGRSFGLFKRINRKNSSISTYRLSGPRNTVEVVKRLLETLYTTSAAGTKIPNAYKVGSWSTRESLLAGLLDAGSLVTENGWDFVSQHRRLSEDVAFVARSLGLTARVTKASEGIYYCVSISGNTSLIPCRQNIPSTQNSKDVSITDISLTACGEDDYYGIVLDGDRLFMLGDFTVTHNTVVGLNTAAELGRSTLVIVPLQRLAKQWTEAAVNVLGMKRSEIGIVQGPKCQYDKKLCIGIINSISKKEYDLDFYHAFGTVIWDELHKYGSQMFSNSIAMFPSRYKIGLTATPEARKDGTAAVYMTYFGGNQVISEATSVPAKVHVMRYKKAGRIFGEDDRSLMLRCLQSDFVRNEVLVRVICQLYDHGRNILGLGHSIDHIEYLITALIEAGVPREDIGQFTAEYSVESGARKKTSDAYLDWCKKTPVILLATTQMMTLGIDVPRLDAGIELTPRTDGIQPLGRIRRAYLNKEMALWYSFVDTRFGMLQGYYRARKKEWREDPQIKVIEHA